MNFLTGPDTLKLGETVARLYMHEVVLHAGSASEADMQPPFTEEFLTAIRPAQAEKLSAAHISSLSTCITSVHVFFDIFLRMPTTTVRALPTFHFVRLVYTTVVLIRMAMDTTVRNSELRSMLELSDFKIEEYLNPLIALLDSAAEGNQCPNAKKFGMVLGVLRNLYQRRIQATVGSAVEVIELLAGSDTTQNSSLITPAQHHI